MEKITLPLVNYKNCKLLEGDSEFLELHDEYFRSYGSYLVEWSGDDDAVTKERRRDFSYIVFKDSIANIDRAYFYSDECWKVVVCSFAGTSLEFVMKSKTAACALADKLLDWKLSKTSLDAS